MFTKILIICSLVTLCYSGLIHVPSAEEKDYYAHPQYKFSYGVTDPLTGDNKSQQEERDGDSVKGVYTVAEPDGTLRTVHYTADDHSGFNAYVSRSGKAVHPQIYAKQPNAALYAAEPFSHH